MGKNGVGMFRRQFFAVIRRAGLKDNRSSLWRATNIQRPGDLEEITVVIQGMQLLPDQRTARLFVAHKGIPSQESHSLSPRPDIHRQCGSAARARVFFAGESSSPTFQRRGHHVPARAAVAQMIEAGKLARHGKGLAVGGG
jgi:hypothetical protein